MGYREKNTRIHVYSLFESGITTIDVPNDALVKFREMIQRATDKWPDAPDYIKHFADIITNGAPMQDYFDNPNLSGPIKSNSSDKA